MPTQTEIEDEFGIWVEANGWAVELRRNDSGTSLLKPAQARRLAAILRQCANVVEDLEDDPEYLEICAKKGIEGEGS